MKQVVMVNFCAIVGCSNRSTRDERSFYRLPKVTSTRFTEKRQNLIRERRKKWLKKIRRSDLIDNEGSLKNLDNIRICSDHFISGKHFMCSILCADSFDSFKLTPKQARGRDLAFDGRDRADRRNDRHVELFTIFARMKLKLLFYFQENLQNLLM